MTSVHVPTTFTPESGCRVSGSVTLPRIRALPCDAIGLTDGAHESLRRRNRQQHADARFQGNRKCQWSNCNADRIEERVEKSYPVVAFGNRVEAEAPQRVGKSVQRCSCDDYVGSCKRTLAETVENHARERIEISLSSRPRDRCLCLRLSGDGT